jgi:hypothetical protein
MLTGPPPKFHETWDILQLIVDPVWRGVDVHFKAPIFSRPSLV